MGHFSNSHVFKGLDVYQRFCSIGKARRLKQAKEEAQEEIEKYRKERERQFREFEAKHMGSKEDVAAKIDADTKIRISDMNRLVQVQKAVVIALFYIISFSHVMLCSITVYVIVSFNWQSLCFQLILVTNGDFLGVLDLGHVLVCSHDVPSGDFDCLLMPILLHSKLLDWNLLCIQY